jgi:NitT/TauT family transport system ATP-binding protein
MAGPQFHHAHPPHQRAIRHAMTAAEKPEYLRQEATVAARFERLKQRPVALSVRRLTKRFESNKGVVTALENVSFDVHKREFMCVIGPSGCGKSTLVRILAGLETASEGELRVYDEPVAGPGADRGMVFQGYTLFPWLTVKENVMFGPRVAGRTAFSAESEAREWIELVGLSKFENSYPHQLSGGMKQRVAIARALANQPRVLFMDEPFGALDAQTRANMQAYLLDIWKKVDITIVFITHDLDEAVFLSDRILVLDANPGRVREVVEVAVPRPRSFEQLADPMFMATRRHIEQLIHPPRATETENFPVLRMAVADSDVL